MPVGEAIDLVLRAGVFPGSQSTADFLARSLGESPTFWLWDLNRSTEGAFAQLPAEREVPAAAAGGSSS